MGRVVYTLPFLGAGGCDECGAAGDTNRYLLRTGRTRYAEGRWWQEVLGWVTLCARCGGRGFELPRSSVRRKWEQHLGPPAWID